MDFITTPEDDRPRYVGCSDHGCVYGHPGGMGTNGGCKCLDEIRRKCGWDERRKVEAGLRRLRLQLREKGVGEGVQTQKTHPIQR